MYRESETGNRGLGIRKGNRRKGLEMEKQPMGGIELFEITFAIEDFKLICGRLQGNVPQGNGYPEQ